MSLMVVWIPCVLLRWLYTSLGSNRNNIFMFSGGSCKFFEKVLSQGTEKGVRKVLSHLSHTFRTPFAHLSHLSHTFLAAFLLKFHQN